MIHVLDLKPAQSPIHAMLTPALAQRIRAFAAEHDEANDPDLLAANVISRLWGRDPTLMTLVLATDEGSLVGHLVIYLQKDTRTVLYILQAKADGDVGDAMKRAAVVAEDWGRQQGATLAIGVTSRNPDAWKRSYGYRLTRSIVSKSLVNGGNGDG